jgi:glycine cleavage system H protein
MNFPADLLYTEHDEWIRKDGDVVTVGITDYAQDALGELVFVQLPTVGDTIAAGDAVAEVESTKATAEIYTPVAGEIVEVNEALDGGESAINEDPYGAGWLFKVRVSDPAGLSALVDSPTYKARIAG